MNKLIKMSLTVIFLSFSASNAITIVNDTGKNLKLGQVGTVRSLSLKNKPIYGKEDVQIQFSKARYGALTVEDDKNTYYVTLFNPNIKKIIFSKNKGKKIGNWYISVDPETGKADKQIAKNSAIKKENKFIDDVSAQKVEKVGPEADIAVYVGK